MCIRLDYHVYREVGRDESHYSNQNNRNVDWWEVIRKSFPTNLLKERNSRGRRAGMNRLKEREDNQNGIADKNGSDRVNAIAEKVGKGKSFTTDYTKYS